MVPFVLNDWVSGPVASNIPYATAGWNKAAYFNRVGLVKPTAFATHARSQRRHGLHGRAHGLHEGPVRDRHLRVSAGASRVLVGIDNEPDLYHCNFPMLQEGSRRRHHDAERRHHVGKRVTAEEFTQRTITFASAREAPSRRTRTIVGPSHYHFDGFTTWHELENAQFRRTATGTWMTSSPPSRRRATRTGVRLLDTWDFHWYPQRVSSTGRTSRRLDNSVRTMTAAEIDAVVQGPRSYWDPTYDESRGSRAVAPGRSRVHRLSASGSASRRLSGNEARRHRVLPGRPAPHLERPRRGRLARRLRAHGRPPRGDVAVGGGSSSRTPSAPLKLLRNADGNGPALRRHRRSRSSIPRRSRRPRSTPAATSRGA